MYEARQANSVTWRVVLCCYVFLVTNGAVAINGPASRICSFLFSSRQAYRETIEKQGINSLANYARQKFRTSTRVAKKLLEDEEFGPRLLYLIEVARWLETEQSHEINASAAKTINENEIKVGNDTANFASDAEIGALMSTDIAKLTAENWQKQLDSLASALAERNQSQRDSLPHSAQIYRTVADSKTTKGDGEHSQSVELLMRTYVPRGVDYLTREHRLRAAAAINETDAELINKAYRAAYSTMQNGERGFLKFARRTDTAISKTEYKSTIALIGLVSSYFGVELRINHLSSIELYKKYEEIREEAIAAASLNQPDQNILRGLIDAYFETYWKGLIPTRYKPVTAEELTNHQVGALGSRVRRLVQLFDQEKSKKRKKSSSDKPVSVSPSELPTRAERMQAYRLEKQRRQNEAEKSTLQSRSFGKDPLSTDKHALETKSPARVELTAGEGVERAVATRSISDQRAENTMKFYDSLSETEKLNFRRAVGQLLNRENRRLSDVVDGSIESLTATEIYELRIQGDKNPIRVYFGIDPQDGPMLILAHFKKGDAKTQIEASNKAWKKSQQ